MSTFTWILIGGCYVGYNLYLSSKYNEKTYSWKNYFIKVNKKRIKQLNKKTCEK